MLFTFKLQRLQDLVGEAPRPGLQRGVVWTKLQFRVNPLGVVFEEHRGGPRAPVSRWRVGRGRR